MKHKWKSYKFADLICDKLKVSLNKKEKSIILNLEGFNSEFSVSFEEYLEILLSNYQFSSDVPYTVREDIVRYAIFSCADNDRINSGALDTEISKRQKKYLKKEKEIFYLLSTISIPYKKELGRIRVNDCEISFLKNMPINFKTENIDTQKRFNPYLKSFDDYIYLKVKVEARCFYSAYNKAKTELDFIRGIWNYTINSNNGKRFTLGIPKRINNINLGPYQTMHQSDGSIATNSFWYSNFIGQEPHSLSKTVFFKNYQKCKYNEKSFRRIIKKSKLGHFLKESFVRYANALDSDDMTVTFQHLWSLLEFLTLTGKDNYKVTIKRASLPFVEREYVYNVLEQFRDKRNKIIHRGKEFDSSEHDAYLLMSFINKYLSFIINNFKNFSSEEHLKNLLSLPHEYEKAELKNKELEKEIELYKLANKLNLYS
ncbi:MAG: hypothetical protein GY760_00945 [Deltaproteobacteria bacterium]|nr:hypothetical protein [Deltaproteobacteria bacterium]